MLRVVGTSWYESAARGSAGVAGVARASGPRSRHPTYVHLLTDDLPDAAFLDQVASDAHPAVEPNHSPRLAHRETTG
jgi:hypothetical protein